MNDRRALYVVLSITFWFAAMMVLGYMYFFSKEISTPMFWFLLLILANFSMESRSTVHGMNLLNRSIKSQLWILRRSMGTEEKDG